MFDVGFSEMVVIAVVALIVIGPEKLPRVARTVGALIGRMQRYVNDVKADINREIELDELKKLHTSVKDAAQSIESTMRETVSSFESQATELNSAVGGAAAAPAPELSNQELEQAIAAAETHAGGQSAAPLGEPSPQASLALEPARDTPPPAPAQPVFHQEAMAAAPLQAAAAPAPPPAAPEPARPVG